MCIVQTRHSFIRSFFHSFQLADLLDSARKEYEGQTGEVQFDPESVIFVANKWDQIPDGDRSDVHQDICDKLYQCCPEFTKSQIYPFSAKEVG